MESGSKINLGDLRDALRSGCFDRPFAQIDFFRVSPVVARAICMLRRASLAQSRLRAALPVRKATDCVAA